MTPELIAKADAVAAAAAELAAALRAAAQPPAPAPAPAPAPPPAEPQPGFEQYLLGDTGDGPTRAYSNAHLLLRWENPNTGDWTDAAGTPQGAAAYAEQRVNAVGWWPFDITALIAADVERGEHMGVLLRTTDTVGVTFSGRLSEHPPRLEIETSEGAYAPPLQAYAKWSTTTANGQDSTQGGSVAANGSAIARWDLRGVKGPVKAAVMHLHCKAKGTTTAKPMIRAFRALLPLIVVGAGNAAPLQGIAADGEAALRGHPSVLLASDFADQVQRVAERHRETAEVLPDPDHPGTMMLRGRFRAGTAAEGDKRGSYERLTMFNPADLADPLRPPRVTHRVMHARVSIYLEADWRSTRDSNKMGIGWDVRMGWWNDAQGGYWQSTTGNGGAPGTGLKVFAPAKKNGGSQTADRWEYQGHSIRMEAGKASAVGNPYGQLRPIQSYCYNLDQATDFGQMIRLGTACIATERWHDIEQRLVLNTISGPFDALGNGTANADGELWTWLDGVLVSVETGLRWTRHPELGIRGPWLNWFYGGKQPSECEMHYRMNNFAVATEYIGPVRRA